MRGDASTDDGGSRRAQAARLSQCLLAIAVVAVLIVPAAAGTDRRFPPGSRWHLDLARSDFGTAPALSQDDFTIEMDSGSVLSFSETRVLADGTTVARRWSGRADGTLAPFAGQAGASGSYDVHDGAFRVLDPDGTRSDASVSFSEDGQTMIVSVSARTGTGKPFQETLTYQRAD